MVKAAGTHPRHDCAAGNVLRKHCKRANGCIFGLGLAIPQDPHQRLDQLGAAHCIYLSSPQYCDAANQGRRRIPASTI